MIDYLIIVVLFVMLIITDVMIFFSLFRDYSDHVINEEVIDVDTVDEDVYRFTDN